MKNIIEDFYKFEIENDVFSYRYEGFPIWLFVRESIFSSVFQKDTTNESFKRAKANYSLSYKKKISLSINSISSFISLCFCNNLKCDILALSSFWDRKLIKGKSKSIYYDSLFDILEKNNLNCKLLLLPSLINDINIKHYYKSNRIIKGDWTILPDLLFRFHKIKCFSKGLNDKIITLCKNLNIANNDIELLIKNMNYVISRNIFRFRFISWAISKISPKILIVNSSYSPMTRIIINKVKNNNGIVIEMQHAHVYTKHIGYNNKTINSFYLPNYLALYSNYYSTIVSHILNKNIQTFVVGNPMKIKDIPKTHIVKNSVLIISQPTIMTKIADFLNKDFHIDFYKITIKTHPRSDSEEKFYHKKLINKNISIVTEGSLTDYIILNEYVIGSYSSGIIEALELERQVYLFDIPESDYFEEMLRLKLAYKISSLNDLKHYKFIKKQIYNEDYLLSRYVAKIKKVSNL